MQIVNIIGKIVNIIGTTCFDILVGWVMSGTNMKPFGKEEQSNSNLQLSYQSLDIPGYFLRIEIYLVFPKTK